MSFSNKVHQYGFCWMIISRPLTARIVIDISPHVLIPGRMIVQRNQIFATIWVWHMHRTWVVLVHWLGQEPTSPLRGYGTRESEDFLNNFLFGNKCLEISLYYLMYWSISLILEEKFHLINTFLPYIISGVYVTIILLSSWLFWGLRLNLQVKFSIYSVQVEWIVWIVIIMYIIHITKCHPFLLLYKFK
jgi:hypothetical protein